MKIKVLEFTRKPRPGWLEKDRYFDSRMVTIEITEKPFLWFMKPKERTVKVYKPFYAAGWKYAESGERCEDKVQNFLDAYEELNEL